MKSQSRFLLVTIPLVLAVVAAAFLVAPRLLAATSSTATTTTTAADTSSFSINADGPVFSNLTPAINSIIGTSVPVPLISASWADTGAAVDIYSAQLKLDNTDVTSYATINQYGISYQPARLGLSYHWVTLSVKDKAGHSSTMVWAFMIVDTLPPVVNMPSLCGGATANTRPALDFTYYDPGAADSPATGVGMDLKGTFMYVDNAAVTASSDQYGVSYTPAALAEGHHLVTIKVGDRAANKATCQCAFTVDTQPPGIDSISPGNGAIAGPGIPQIRIGWHDDGAGIDVYASSLKLDGTDVTKDASLTQHELTYTPANLASGQHAVQLTVKDNVGNEASRSWSFTYSPPQVSYYAPWYDSVSPGMNGNWILISNQADTTATVDVYIGGAWKPNPDDKSGHFFVPAHGKLTPVFPDTIGGPVRVISRTGEELLVSQRVLYRDSFNETLAVRDSDLDTAYSSTWYDSKSPQINGDWILVGNSAAADAYVEIYIGHQKMSAPAGQYGAASSQYGGDGGAAGNQYEWRVPADGMIRPSFADTIGGPVRVVCTSCGSGQKIIVSQRVLYGSSFSETMGVPDKALDKEYYFTWYDSRPQDDINGDWILVGNPGDTTATVDVYIGGAWKPNPDDKSGHFFVPAHGKLTPVFPDTIGGPVRVVCTSCGSSQNLIVSQRVLYKSSFEEVQGASPRDLGTSAAFPWYDFNTTGMNGNWILIGNVDASRDAYSQVFLGGGSAALSMYGSGGDRFFAGAGGGSVTPIFPGVIGGPVTVTCVTCQPDQKLIISQRVIYKDSFNEVVGKPPRR